MRLEQGLPTRRPTSCCITNTGNPGLWARGETMGISLSRREFLGTASAGAAGVAAGRSTAAAAPAPARAGVVSVSVFSKHLQYLDYRALAGTIAEAGFGGIDLTVRDGGHVLPERVGDDLPKAVEAAREPASRSR